MDILSYVNTYGLSILIIALAVIFVIGVLKACKVFNKISSKNVKKFIYYGLDILLAFGGSAIYFAIFHKDFSGYLVYSAAQLAVTTTLYAIYENTGLRSLVKLVLGVVAKWLDTNPDNRINNSLKKLGLNDEAIASVKTLVSSEVAKIQLDETKVEQETVAIQKTADAVEPVNQIKF